MGHRKHCDFCHVLTCCKENAIESSRKKLLNNFTTCPYLILNCFYDWMRRIGLQFFLSSAMARKSTSTRRLLSTDTCAMFYFEAKLQFYFSPLRTALDSKWNGPLDGRIEFTNELKYTSKCRLVQVTYGSRIRKEAALARYCCERKTHTVSETHVTRYWHRFLSVPADIIRAH